VKSEKPQYLSVGFLLDYSSSPFNQTLLIAPDDIFIQKDRIAAQEAAT